MEDENFVLDAPHFVDLTNADEDFNDATSVHEYFFQSCSIERYETDDTAIVQSSNTMYFSPSDSQIEEPIPEAGNLIKMRRSMSNGNLVMFSEQKGRLLHEPTCKIIKEDGQSCGGLSKTRSKSISKGSMDQLNKGAHQPRQYGSYDNFKKLTQNKFVSMAEQISMFQNRTPERFRIKAPVNTKPALQITVPESPALTTKLRARPDQHKVLSHEERELIEFHNLQKCKIKANPVNKKILQGPVKALVHVEKKPSTVPVPFKLTEVPPKQAVPEKKYVFHATAILKASPQKTTVTNTRTTTKPITPTFMKNYKPPMRCSSSNKEATTVNPEVNRPRMTKPEPFSFAARDKLVTEKREKLIQKILEEERRAREFHANPIPKAIYKPNSKRTSLESINSNKKGSLKSSSEDVSSNFKARPAKVLQKKPFMPAPSDKVPTVPAPFELESERRRLERLAFEEQQRQRMETMRNLELHREEMKKAAEKEEIARIRKLAEIKARPIPNFKPMEIHPSDKKLTEPKSPNFRKINKENLPFNN